MRNHFVGNASRIASDASWIKCSGTMKPLRARLSQFWRGRGFLRPFGRSFLRFTRRLDLGLALLLSYSCPKQQARNVLLRDVHHFATAKASVAPCRLIEAFRVRKRILIPCQQAKRAADGINQHGGFFETRQIGASARYQADPVHVCCSASLMALGWREMACRYAAAGASGARRPCSQFFNVGSGIR